MPGPNGTWAHGLTGYRVHKCRCEVCKAAAAARSARRRRKRKERFVATGVVATHGAGGYRIGCRCTVCSAARSGCRRRSRLLRRERFKDGELSVRHGTQGAYKDGCRCPTCVEASNKARRSYVKSRRVRDPAYKLLGVCRTRLTASLKGAAKAAKTLELVGCSAADLKSRLEAMFLPGMSWSNYGSAWCVDHVKPCAGFDLADPEQQKLCFHYSNLQPLWNEVNADKSDLLDFDVDYELSQTPYPS